MATTTEARRRVRPWWDGVDRRRPLNPDCPWIHNVLAAYLPSPWLVGGNRLFDLMNRYPATFGAGSAAPTWLPASCGSSIVFDGSNDIITVPPALGTAFGTHASRTIIAIGRNSNSSTDGRLVTFGVTSPNRFHIGSVGPDGFIYVGNSTILTATGSMPVGIDFMAAAEYNSATSTATMYINGVAVASAGSVSLTGTTTAPYFGGYAPGNTHWSGRLYSAFVMKNALGAAGHTAVYADYCNGWQSLLNRPSNRMISLPSGPPPVLATLMAQSVTWTTEPVRHTITPRPVAQEVAWTTPTIGFGTTTSPVAQSVEWSTGTPGRVLSVTPETQTAQWSAETLSATAALQVAPETQSVEWSVGELGRSLSVVPVAQIVEWSTGTPSLAHAVTPVAQEVGWSVAAINAYAGKRTQWKVAALGAARSVTVAKR